jgi:hypothetical protein
MATLIAFYYGFEPARDAEAEAIVSTFGGEWIGQGFHGRSGKRAIEWELPPHKLVNCSLDLVAAGYEVGVRFTTAEKQMSPKDAARAMRGRQ